MTFQEFYDDFQEDFGNHPKKFTDTHTGDGDTRLFQLTEKMISEQSEYDPTVKVNNVIVNEGSDFIVNYTLGTILFTVAPPNDESVSFEGYFQKVNLTNLIKYFNRAAIKVAVQFPLLKTEEITVSDVSGATADDEITELDMDSAPFSLWDDIKAVFQRKTDFRGLNFLRRERYLIFNAGNRDNSLGNLSDYSYFGNNRRSGKWLSVLKYPYFLRGIKKYAVIDPTVALPLAETIEIPDISKSQMLIQTALLMYQGLYHSMASENASSLRFSKLSEINKMIMSLSFAIKDNRWNEAPGRGHSPDHRTRFVNTNDDNA